MRRTAGRKHLIMRRRRAGRRLGMSSLNANPFRQGTGRSLKMLSTLQGQRASNPAGVLMVWIYADWCGHCHRFLPVWKALVKKYPEIDFVIMDGDSPSFNSSDKPADYPQVTGFPTLWMFGSNSQRPVVYRGQRTVSALERALHDL